MIFIPFFFLFFFCHFYNFFLPRFSGIRVSQRQMSHTSSRHSAIGSLVMKTVLSSSITPQSTVRYRGNSIEHSRQDTARKTNSGSQGTTTVGIEGVKNRVPDPLPDTYHGPRHILVAPSPVEDFQENNSREADDGTS